MQVMYKVVLVFNRPPIFTATQKVQSPFRRNISNTITQPYTNYSCPTTQNKHSKFITFSALAF
jgi:hypothetical protein